MIKKTLKNKLKMEMGMNKEIKTKSIKRQDLISLSKNNNNTFYLTEELVQEEYKVYFTDLIRYDFLVAPSIYYNENEMVVYAKYEVWKSLMRDKKINELLSE